jgi:hypothetical protein
MQLIPHRSQEFSKHFSDYRLDISHLEPRYWLEKANLSSCFKDPLAIRILNNQTILEWLHLEFVCVG